MSLSKPLSYESLKRVLEHMEPNQRFHVAKHCPSIRSIEKLVPLKLRTLHLDEYRLKVNDTTYYRRSHRKYPEGATVPEAHRIAEKHDLFLDKYGAPCSPWAHCFIMEGDLQFELEDWEPTEADSEPTDQELIEEYMRMIELCERKMAAWRANGLLEKVGAGERIVEDLRVRLQPFLNRQDKILPEFEVVEQLVISSPHSKQVEFIHPDVQIWDIMKNLTTFLFGGRRDSIEVNHLYFSDKIRTLVRLPPKVQFKIRELTASAWKLDVCEPIIDAKSYPLERLVDRDFDGEEPLEQTAKELIIVTLENYLSEVSTIPNRVVHLQKTDFKIGELAKLFGNICRQWKNREIGTRFSFQIKKRSVMELMDRLFRVSEKFSGIRSEKRLIRVPLNHFSEIQLTFEDIDNITVPDDNFDHEGMGSQKEDYADSGQLNAVWREIFGIESDEEESDEDSDDSDDDDDVEMEDGDSDDSSDIEMESDEDYHDRTNGVLIIKVVAI